MLKRVIVIILAVAYIFSFSSIAIAETAKGIEEFSSSTSGTRYTYISYTSALMSINSIGLVSCSASIQAYSTVDSVRIQHTCKNMTMVG